MTRKRTRFDADERSTLRAMADSVNRLTALVERLLGREAAAASQVENMPSGSLGKSAITRKPRNLTKRQREIARLIADGLSNEEISERLHLAYDTVKSHRTNIYDRLGVHNVAEMIAQKEAWEQP